MVSCCNSCGEKKEKHALKLEKISSCGEKKVSHPFVFVAATNVGLEDIFSKKFARPYSLLSSFDKKLFNALPSFCFLPHFCEKSHTKNYIHTCSTKIENEYNFLYPSLILTRGSNKIRINFFVSSLPSSLQIGSGMLSPGFAIITS